MLNLLVYETDCDRMLRAGMSKLSHYIWTVIDRLCKANARRKRTQNSHESAKLDVSFAPCEAAPRALLCTLCKLTYYYVVIYLPQVRGSHCLYNLVLAL